MLKIAKEFKKLLRTVMTIVLAVAFLLHKYTYYGIVCELH